jgi:tripartite-type tricarboxylate transporter receptor subunit TctC
MSYVGAVLPVAAPFSGGALAGAKGSRRQIAYGQSALLALAALAIAVASSAAFAQQWPVKPVRLIVPFPPGGGADFIGRVVSPPLTTVIGHSVVVENRTGAAGTIGYEAGAKAVPDGYTFTIVSTSYSVNPSLYKLAFDPVKDIQPVIALCQGPYIVAVHPSLPVQNMRQLIALAKAKPGALNYASSGQGGNVHLVMELFMYMTGTRMTHVPYKGTGPALIDTVSGQTSLIFGSTSGTLPLVRSGRLRGLAVTTAQRSQAAPEFPTVAESGVPGFDVFDWQGMIGPRGLPKAIVDRLNSELNKILRSKEMADRLEAGGVEASGGTPEEFSAFVAKQIELWRKVVTQAGVKLE